MRASTPGAWMVRVIVALLLATTLAAVGLLPSQPDSLGRVVAQDDDDDDGGDIDEDDDSDKEKKGEKEKKDKEDKDKEDDEDEIVTRVPTNTPDQSTEPTQVALTPVSSPTQAASTPVTTGTLLIRLRSCPEGTDPAVGASALRDACPDGVPAAGFELAGQSGIYDGWRRNVTTDDGGDARVSGLAEGAYSLTLEELDWCTAEASSVDDGLIVIEPAETTEVTAYLCGDPGTPTGS